MIAINADVPEFNPIQFKIIKLLEKQAMNANNAFWLIFSSLDTLWNKGIKATQARNPRLNGGYARPTNNPDNNGRINLFIFIISFYQDRFEE